MTTLPMKAATKRFLLILCLGLSALGLASAQSSGEGKESYRSFSSEKLEQYRTDSDYAYERPSSAAPDWWDRFRTWLGNLLQSVFGVLPSGRTIFYILYTVSVLIILWVVIRLTGMDLNTIIRRENKGPAVPHHISEENIHELDFEKEMEKARAEGKWRVLIRLQYLFALKRLADRGVLKVSPGKTNHDYIYEITGDLRDPFARLSRIFEYTWYGHFEASAEVVERSGRELSELQKKLSA